jgi:uncharacterized membrane protein (DUF106 family)
MSTTMKNAMSGAVPRWALVILSAIACYFLVELVKEMRVDHELVRAHEYSLSEHKQSIASIQRTLERLVDTQQRLALSQAQLTTLIDERRKNYQ